jgi:hypothetical protein
MPKRIPNLNSNIFTERESKQSKYNGDDSENGNFK